MMSIPKDANDGVNRSNIPSDVIAIELVKIPITSLNTTKIMLTTIFSQIVYNVLKSELTSPMSFLFFLETKTNYYTI